MLATNLGVGSAEPKLVGHAVIGVVAIASPLERNYIGEWIAYHKKIGVGRFFIFTNNWSLESHDRDVLDTRVDGHGL